MTREQFKELCPVMNSVLHKGDSPIFKAITFPIHETDIECLLAFEDRCKTFKKREITFAVRVSDDSYTIERTAIDLQRIRQKHWREQKRKERIAEKEKKEKEKITKELARLKKEDDA